MFLNINSNAIVNTDFIIALQVEENNIKVTMKNGSIINVPQTSKKKAHEIFDDIGFSISQKDFLTIYCTTVYWSERKSLTFKVYYKHKKRIGMSVNSDIIKKEFTYIDKNFGTFSTSIDTYKAEEDASGHPILVRYSESGQKLSEGYMEKLTETKEL